MAQFKLVLSDPKTGKSKQLEVKDSDAKTFIGKKIRENLKGEAFGLSGYEVEITGGSDSAGLPMRPGIAGKRKVIYTSGGVGAKPKGNGIMQRKLVCGDTIGTETAQINLKVLKIGTNNLFEEAKPAEEKKEEASKTEEKTPADEKNKDAPKEEGEKK